MTQHAVVNAPSLSAAVSQATNRVVGFSYDNGSMTNFPNSTGYSELSYDVDNRLVQALK